MKTFLITGTTSGLGLEIARNLASNKNNKVIMAVRNLKKAQTIISDLSGNLEAVQLDLSKLSNIRDFVQTWNTPLNGLVNNAGVQFANETRFTNDGFEETIAVNHLAAFMLTIGLIPYLTGARILFIGSGTHNPYYPYGKMFGFRGAQYTNIDALLSGKSTSKSLSQANRDRYATSKLLNLVTAIELSRRHNEFSTFVLDPGLMPETRLARNYSRFKLFLWNHLISYFTRFMSDTSSSQQSGKTAAWIMESTEVKDLSGQIFSFDRKPYKYVWNEVVFDEQTGNEVYENSMKVVEQFLTPIQK